MLKKVGGIALMALLALHPTPSRAVIIDRIAATVNEEVITTAEVDKEVVQMQRELGKVPVADKETLKNVALNRLVDKKLVEQKIRELDIKVPDEEVKLAIDDVKKQNNITTDEQLSKALATQGMTLPEYKAQLREQLERVKLMGQEVRSKIQVGEKEVRDYYNANKAKYGGEEQFKARHIFFRVDKNASAADVAKVEAEAAKVRKEAMEGKDFAELAKKYSSDPAAARDGGDLGTFKRSDMIAEIGDTVAAMKPGEISQPVVSPAGVHIIKLEEKTSTAAKPFDEVKADIEDILYKKKSDERFAQWVKDLRSAAAIEIKTPEAKAP